MGEESASESPKAGFTISSKTLALAVGTILFLVSFYLWTLPFQHNPLPFGEGDSAWHFAIGDHITSSDKATFRLSYVIGVWYYGFNKILGPFSPEYPPSNHVDYALMQVLGGERFIPVFIFRAIASFLGVFAVFFLVYRLFGLLPAFIAGLGLSFSLREQMSYLFGQQPTLIAIVITPLTLYAWYRYLTSIYGSNEDSTHHNGSIGSGNAIYLYLTFALLASQYLLHFQGFVASVVIMAVFAAALFLKYRKLPVSKSNIRQIALAVLLLLVVAAPFAAIYLGAGDNAKPSFKFSRLFEWGISPDYYQGSYPPAFSLFSAEYAKILVPFLVVGLILLLVRLFLVKNNVKELFLLSWLVGVYIILHLDVFTSTGLNRLARMLPLENYIFFTLIALSVVWLPQTIASFLKLNQRIASAAKYVLAAILIFALVMTSGRATYTTLSQAYGSIDRITPVQADFAENYLSKLPEKAFIYDPSLKIAGQLGFNRYPKMRWMLAISGRHVGRYDGGQIANGTVFNQDAIYFMFDYSDFALLASNGYQQQVQPLASQLQQIEKSMFNNTQPIYDVDNIRLYKYEPT